MRHDYKINRSASFIAISTKERCTEYTSQEPFQLDPWPPSSGTPISVPLVQGSILTTVRYLKKIALPSFLGYLSPPQCVNTSKIIMCSPIVRTEACISSRPLSMAAVKVDAARDLTNAISSSLALALIVDDIRFHRIPKLKSKGRLSLLSAQLLDPSTLSFKHTKQRYCSASSKPIWLATCAGRFLSPHSPSSTGVRLAARRGPGLRAGSFLTASVWPRGSPLSVKFVRGLHSDSSAFSGRFRQRG